MVSGKQLSLNRSQVYEKGSINRWTFHEESQGSSINFRGTLRQPDTSSVSQSRIKTQEKLKDVNVAQIKQF